MDSIRRLLSASKMPEVRPSYCVLAWLSSRQAPKEMMHLDLEFSAQGDQHDGFASMGRLMMGAFFLHSPTSAHRFELQALTTGVNEMNLQQSR